MCVSLSYCPYFNVSLESKGLMYDQLQEKSSFRAERNVVYIQLSAIYLLPSFFFPLSLSHLKNLR